MKKIRKKNQGEKNWLKQEDLPKNQTPLASSKEDTFDPCLDHTVFSKPRVVVTVDVVDVWCSMFDDVGSALHRFRVSSLKQKKQ